MGYVTAQKKRYPVNAYETAAMRDLLDASDLFARARDANASLACQAWACDPAAHVEAIADLAAKTGGMAATRLRAAAEQARMAAPHSRALMADPKCLRAEIMEANDGRE